MQNKVLWSVAVSGLVLSVVALALTFSTAARRQTASVRSISPLTMSAARGNSPLIKPNSASASDGEEACMQRATDWLNECLQGNIEDFDQNDCWEGNNNIVNNECKGGRLY